MSFTLTPIKTPIDDLLQTREPSDRYLKNDELWAIGNEMIKTGQLIRLTIKDGNKTLVDTRW